MFVISPCVCLHYTDIVYDFLSEEEEKVEERVFMKTWNPVSVSQ